MKKICKLAFLLCGLAGLPVAAQEPVPPPAPAYQPLSPDQLDQLLGPIALYPDPLISEILPAATLPTQIVMADRYLSNGGDANAADQQPWDPSVQALTRYPTVLQWMDTNLDWTAEVGQAFLNQQQDVMDSIQRLRTQASNLGNLQSTPQQQVVNDDGDIEILPAQSDEIYLPSYQPDEVYDQGGFAVTFVGYPFPIGIWLDNDFDWHNHHLVYWDHDHPRPPDWWRGRHNWNNAGGAGRPHVWTPQNRTGTVAGNGGDRGWNNAGAGSSFVNHVPSRNSPSAAPAAHREVPTATRPAPVTRPAPITRPAPVMRPAPAPVTRSTPVTHPVPEPVQRYQPAPRTSSGPFIGIQSSRDTRAFSERGQQSMQAVTHSAPAPEVRSAPAPSSGGGGGGGRSGGGGGGGGGRR